MGNSCIQVCGCMQWLLCLTVALKWLITLHILLSCHHLTVFCSPTWTKRNIWLGNSIGPTMRSYLQLRTFRGSGWDLLPRESKRCNTDGSRSTHLFISVKFHHCIIVSLQTFQPTLIHIMILCFLANIPGNLKFQTICINSERYLYGVWFFYTACNMV